MNNFNENITLEYKQRKYKINRDDSIYMQKTDELGHQ